MNVVRDCSRSYWDKSKDKSKEWNLCGTKKTSSSTPQEAFVRNDIPGWKGKPQLNGDSKVPAAPERRVITAVKVSSIPVPQTPSRVSLPSQIITPNVTPIPPKIEIVASTSPQIEKPEEKKAETENQVTTEGSDRVSKKEASVSTEQLKKELISPKIVLIHDQSNGKDVEKISKKIDELTHSNSQKICYSDLKEDAMPKTPFIAFNFLYNPHIKNSAELNTLQRKASQLSKENCVFVALDRLKCPRSYDEIEKTGFRGKKFEKKLIVINGSSPDISQFFVEKSFQKLTKEMLDIYQEFAINLNGN